MTSAIIRILKIGCLAAGLSAAAARAETPAAAAGEPTPFQDAAPVAGSDLGTIVGKSDTAMLIRAENSSTVANNSVVGNSTTGGISFDAQTLQNLNGLSLLSANTGNNVSINSSLNLNVAIRP